MSTHSEYCSMHIRAVRSVTYHSNEERAWLSVATQDHTIYMSIDAARDLRDRLSAAEDLCEPRTVPAPAPEEAQ